MRLVERLVEMSERCAYSGCEAAGIEGGHCLEHLTAAEFDVVLIRLRAGEALDARSATISTERLEAILAAREDLDGVPVLLAMDFRRATFSGDVDFGGADFTRGAMFGAATFSDHADFSGVTVDNAVFDWVTFNGDANFDSATVKGAVFVGATFGRVAGFEKAILRHAVFDGASFSGDADFGVATFDGNATFDGTAFSGRVRFDDATFSGDADFSRASFAQARQLGPFSVAERFVVDGSVFVERVGIDIAATVMSARATTFVAGARVRVRGAELAFDDADFARPSTLSGAAIPGSDSESGPPSCAAKLRQPRLITLRGAYIGQLSLSDLDLRACRFFGAHGLESLSIDASCVWPHSPPTRLLERTRIPHRQRETIAEEHHRRGSGWDDPSTQPPPWLESRDGPERLAPPQIAALYRALRMARENDKDAAGAGDLYYGEMEMRRRTPPPQGQGARGRSERAIVTAYWLVSGYGLKASRALVALLAIIAIASIALKACGFTADPSYTRALLYSIESTSSLFRVPNAAGLDITYAGERLQIALRILGPLLIALALLAIRARVKR